MIKSLYLSFKRSAPYFRQTLLKIEFSPQILEKYSSIKHYENPSSGSRVVPCGRTDMTTITDAFRNFANASKNDKISDGTHADNISYMTVPKVIFSFQRFSRNQQGQTA
jgi:hypothetical protein